LQSLLVTPRAGALLFHDPHFPEAPAMSFYDSWSAVMIAAIAGFVLVFTALIGARLLAPFARERGKGVSYECGMLPIGRNWSQVHIRYYLIAILFLIFDVETVFIPLGDDLPGAARFRLLSHDRLHPDPQPGAGLRLEARVLEWKS